MFGKRKGSQNVKEGVAAAVEKRAKARMDRIDSAADAADEFFEGAISLDTLDIDEEEDSLDPNAPDLSAKEKKHREKFPKVLKLFGVLLLITSFMAAALIVLVAFGLALLVMDGQTGRMADLTMVTIGIAVVQVCLYVLIVVVSWCLGVRLIRNHRHKVGTAAHALVGLYALNTLCSVMLTGLDLGLFVNLGIMALLEALSVYADPALRDERELQRRLNRMELRKEAEAGTLGRDVTGGGYIKLNFFNLFWIFTICSLLGWGIETVYHMAVVEPGVFQQRAGLLYGPFSPIYGVGGALLTMALNRFHDKNVIVVFLVSAVVGGAFEYFVSWFMQFSFGITAWDYTGTFLSIDGRTNGQFMAMWGLLGLIWIKAFLPLILQVVNKIPWNWRYLVTAVCAVLMLTDALLTLTSLDCWYQREAGTMEQKQQTALDGFCNAHYDNAFMERRFQSMSMDTSAATRIS